MQPKRVWEVYGTVQSVYDGDTFHADLDLGWGIWKVDQRVRIANINAPEMSTTQGAPAKLFLGAIIKPMDIVKISSQKLDQYGRTLAIVHTLEGYDVGELMIEAGHAVPWL